MANRSLVRSGYHALYGLLVGTQPDLRVWHFQWLSGKALYPSMRRVLASVSGDVLDVGCGDKPFERWLTGADSHFGIDISPGHKVDAVIRPGERWPVADNAFDVVLCTQVLEHVADLKITHTELVRAIKPGGRLIVTIPFMYSEHGTPHDYRRFSRYGLERLFAEDLEVVEVHRLGGLGSSLGTVFLNWVQVVLTSSPILRMALVALLPFWLGLSVTVNVAGLVLDHVDRTGLFYGHVLLIATKPPVP